MKQLKLYFPTVKIGLWSPSLLPFEPTLNNTLGSLDYILKKKKKEQNKSSFFWVTAHVKTIKADKRVFLIHLPYSQWQY